MASKEVRVASGRAGWWRSSYVAAMRLADKRRGELESESTPKGKAALARKRMKNQIAKAIAESHATSAMIPAGKNCACRPDGNRIGPDVFSNSDNELGAISARNRAKRPPLCDSWKPSSLASSLRT